MLRSIIKALIPSKGDIFFTLFDEAACYTYEAAQKFVAILGCNNAGEAAQLLMASKVIKQKATDTNKRVLQALNRTFITPLDRGDIQELSALLNKLAKRIVKLSSKLQVYKIDASSDDCLIKNADTLLLVTQALVHCVHGLKCADRNAIDTANEQINELEENGIEDLKHAMDEMYSGKFDTLTILKLKEIYKSIDGTIDLGLSAAALIMQVSIKNI